MNLVPPGSKLCELDCPCSDWDGSSAEALAARLPLVRRADPDAVQCYSLDRPPADPEVRNVPRECLEGMAIAIRQALPRSIVEVF